VAQAIALRHGVGHILRTGGMAEAYLAAGRVEDALPLAQLYVQVARMVSLRGTEAWALRLLADVEIHRENPDAEAAMQALAAALVVAEELGMRPLAARCWLTRAALDRAFGKPGDACSAATTALAQFRTLDMPRFAAQAEAMLQRS